MTNAKVSVVIPSYNSGGTIEEAIESVLAQDVPVEIIVIDDCSLDDTEHVLQKYKNDPRIRIIVNEKNLGVAASRNRGVKRLFVTESHSWIQMICGWMGKLVKQLKLMDENRNTDLFDCEGTAHGGWQQDRKDHRGAGYCDIQGTSQGKCDQLLFGGCGQKHIDEISYG